METITIECLDNTLIFKKEKLNYIKLIREIFSREIIMPINSEDFILCINTCYIDGKFKIKDENKLETFYTCGIFLGEDPIIEILLTKELYKNNDKNILIKLLDYTFEQEGLKMGYLNFITKDHITTLFEKYASFGKNNTYRIHFKNVLKLYYLTLNIDVLNNLGQVNFTPKNEHLPDEIIEYLKVVGPEESKTLTRWYYTRVYQG